MTPEQFSQAKVLKRAIAEKDDQIDDLLNEQNKFGLPTEMFERHIQEMREYLTSEKARFKTEFDAL